MAMIARLLTLSGLEQEIGKDRRTLGKLLQGVKPDGKSGGRDAWFIKTVLRAIDAETGDTLNPAAEKARLDKARADLAELDLATKHGRMVDASEVGQVWSNVLSRVRNRLLAVAPKTAPLVAAETSTEACHSIIEASIHEALAELAATDVRPATAGERREDGGADAGTAAETDHQ